MTHSRLAPPPDGSIYDSKFSFGSRLDSNSIPDVLHLGLEINVCRYLAALRHTFGMVSRVRVVIIGLNHTSSFFLLIKYPRGDPESSVESVSFVSPACRKKRLFPGQPTLQLETAVHQQKHQATGSATTFHIKTGAPCRYLDGHVKEPYEMSLALEARP